MIEKIKKERSVVVYGQSLGFRLVKYAILAPAFLALYFYKGKDFTLYILLWSVVFSILMHLFYRYMTNVWTRDWGGYVVKN